MSSLAGSVGSTLAYTSTPTSHGSYAYPSVLPRDPHTDPYSMGPSVNQKLDQLLFLFHEERKETSELKSMVMALKDQVEEIKEKQEKDTAVRMDSTTWSKQSYKVPPDLSV